MTLIDFTLSNARRFLPLGSASERVNNVPINRLTLCQQFVSLALKSGSGEINQVYNTY